MADRISSPSSSTQSAAVVSQETVSVMPPLVPPFQLYHPPPILAPTNAAFFAPNTLHMHYPFLANFPHFNHLIIRDTFARSVGANVFAPFANVGATFAGNANASATLRTPRSDRRSGSFSSRQHMRLCRFLLEVLKDRQYAGIISWTGNPREFKVCY